MATADITEFVQNVVDAMDLDLEEIGRAHV